MANTFAPQGFRPFSVYSGRAPSAGFRTRQIATSNSSAIYQGDPVISLNTGYVTVATASTVQLAGIFWGCRYYSKSVNGPKWFPAWLGNTTDVLSGTYIEAYILDNPDEQFLVQSGNGGPVTFASVGNNINLNVGSGGNALSGISGMYADFATIGTTNTLPFRIVDLYSNFLAPNVGLPAINGGDPATAYNGIIVAPNYWDRTSALGI